MNAQSLDQPGYAGDGESLRPLPQSHRFTASLAIAVTVNLMLAIAWLWSRGGETSG